MVEAPAPKPVAAKPVAETPKPVEKPASEPKTEAPKPVAEPKPVEEPKPKAEPKVEAAKPVVAKPVAEPKPVVPEEPKAEEPKPVAPQSIQEQLLQQPTAHLQPGIPIPLNQAGMVVDPITGYGYVPIQGLQGYMPVMDDEDEEDYEDYEPEEEEETPANRNEAVINMHENGETNVEIARALHMGVGEVNLVVDLYKRRKNRQ